MNKNNYKPNGASSSKTGNYRFNIAKNCAVCSKSFITDIFAEEELCSSCLDIYQVLDAEESDGYCTEDDLEEVLCSIVYTSSRTPAYRYD
jgi:hypothetical protein